MSKKREKTKRKASPIRNFGRLNEQEKIQEQAPLFKVEVWRKEIIKEGIVGGQTGWNSVISPHQSMKTCHMIFISSTKPLAS